MRGPLGRLGCGPGPRLHVGPVAYSLWLLAPPPPPPARLAAPPPGGGPTSSLARATKTMIIIIIGRHIDASDRRPMCPEFI